MDRSAVLAAEANGWLARQSFLFVIVMTSRWRSQSGVEDSRTFCGPGQGSEEEGREMGKRTLGFIQGQTNETKTAQVRVGDNAPLGATPPSTELKDG